MFKPEKSRSGFVIKLSDETAQKLAKEEQLAKINAETTNNPDAKHDVIPSEQCEKKQGICSEVTSSDETETVTATEKSTIPSTTRDHETTEYSEKVSSDLCNQDWGDYTPYITYEGEQAIYTDPSTKQRYIWNQDTNSWATKEEDTNRVYSYEDDTHVYTEADGSKCFVHS